MNVILPNRKSLKIKYNDIDSFEPTTEGCRINMNNGKKIEVLNRYLEHTEAIPSIRKLMGVHVRFFYRAKKKLTRRTYE